MCVYTRIENMQIHTSTFVYIFIHSHVLKRKKIPTYIHTHTHACMQQLSEELERETDIATAVQHVVSMVDGKRLDGLRCERERERVTRGRECVCLCV